jgi:AbrB family looped-hinge helix DNA binding protein
MKLLDSNYRIAIPSEIRKKYNIKPGDALDIVDTGNNIVIRAYTKMYEIDETEMEHLRKLYVMLKSSGMLDDFYVAMLSKITQEVDNKCVVCGEIMFLTASNSYKCYKCN